MTASPDHARFDHDPITGESKGLLIEENRTNLITYSQQIEQQTSSTTNFNEWIISSSSNGLIDSNASIAPDGTLSASKFYAGSNLQSPAVYQQVYTTDTNPETLTFSVFAKAGQANRYLQLFIGSGDVDGNPFANLIYLMEPFLEMIVRLRASKIMVMVGIDASLLSLQFQLVVKELILLLI